MFRTKAEAEFCHAAETTNVRLTGLPLRKKDLEAHTVGEIVEQYRDKVAPDHLGYRDDRYRLNGFLKGDIAKESLAFVKKKHAMEYIRQRRSKGNKPSTVRRELNIWVQVFEFARNELGYENLPNIFAGIKIKGGKARRTRRLDEGEFERLDAARAKCRGRNKYYVGLAIRLLIGTGMRKEELFSLRWDDFSLPRREIRIRKSKMDYKRVYPGRTIPLPVWCMLQLVQLAKVLMEMNAFNPKNRIFPMTVGAFSQAFDRIKQKANIVDLHIHDFRHEAKSSFDEMGLSPSQSDHMTGHGPQSQGAAYIHANNREILLKLDNYWMTLYGRPKKTEEELREEPDILRGFTWQQAAYLLAQDQIEQERERKKSGKQATNMEEWLREVQQVGGLK
jgi:integrase